MILFIRKRLIENIFFRDEEASNFFIKIFPKDFNEENIVRFSDFNSFVENNNVFEICEGFAELGLKLQMQNNSVKEKEEILQAHYYDFVFILEEIKGNFKNALGFQKKHATLWVNLKRYSLEKNIKWTLQGDINYSISALHRLGSQIPEIKDEKYLRSLLTKISLKKSFGLYIDAFTN